jgi:hypothetical protein
MIIDLIIMNINELVNFAWVVVPKNPVVASFIVFYVPGEQREQ